MWMSKIIYSNHVTLGCYCISNVSSLATSSDRLQLLLMKDVILPPVSTHTIYLLHCKTNCNIQQVPYNGYNGNHPQKKSFANYLLCRSSRENFRDSGNLIYKNSGRDKKCKKTFANDSRFAKFAKLFFHG